MTGAYLRVQRNGKWESIEVEYLTDNERRSIFSRKSTEVLLDWLHMTCRALRENEQLIDAPNKGGGGRAERPRMKNRAAGPSHLQPICYEACIMEGPFPVSAIPEIEEDNCSVEVLIESHAGFYVGYYNNGDWYESYHGEKLGRQFKAKQWWKLPPTRNA